MFTSVSACINGSVFNGEPINIAAVVGDIISGLALTILGGLVASGTLALSPAAAYAMIAVGVFQIAPFLALLLHQGAGAAHKKLAEMCPSESGYTKHNLT